MVVKVEGLELAVQVKVVLQAVGRRLVRRLTVDVSDTDVELPVVQTADSRQDR